MKNRSKDICNPGEVLASARGSTETEGVSLKRLWESFMQCQHLKNGWGLGAGQGTLRRKVSSVQRRRISKGLEGTCGLW